MENEEMKKETVETTEIVESNGNIQGLEFLGRNSDTEKHTFTNITDKKKLFNLENNIDCLLNDCEGELIRVKEILIKTFKKPMKNPIVDEETGEILKDTETSMSCILIDDNGKSYATGSKTFTIRLMKYLESFGKSDLESEKGLEIKIVKNKTKDSNNKALGFELV